MGGRAITSELSAEAREQVFRGEKALEVLGNQALQAALTALEGDIVAAWEACPARDQEGKEYYWQLYKTTKKFRAVLQGYIEGGKAARLPLPERTAGIGGFIRRLAHG
jgi:hypothetical protein